MEEEEEILNSMPKNVQQFFVEVSTQYRLLYLLAFLKLYSS
jgi:hypothetical protein